MPIDKKNSDSSQVKIDNNSNEISDFELLRPSPNTNLRERLDSMINYANDRVNEYVQLRKMYLEVNLTLMIVIFTFISIVFENFSDKVKSITILLLILYLVIAGSNILYNLFPHKTSFEGQSKHHWKFINRITRHFKRLKEKGSETHPTISSKRNFWATNRFFRGNAPEKVQDLKRCLSKFALNEFNFTKIVSESGELCLKEKLLKDDVKNLFMLFWYQKNYYKHAITTRIITLVSMIYLLLSPAILFLLVNSFC